MATMTQGSLTYLLDEVVTGVAFDSALVGGSMMPSLYFMRAASGRRERFASVGSLGPFVSKTESQPATEDEVSQQFQKTLVPTAYAKSVKFSREVARDEEWGFISRLSQNLGEAFNQTLEDFGSDLFNEIESAATYTAEDGLSIANTAHLNSAGGNSQSNNGSNSLNMAGVKATSLAMRKITNYEGDSKSKIKPDLLLVPVDLEEDAWEIVRSLGRPDNANNAMNMYNGMFNLLVWDELDSTTAWSMIDSAKMKQNLLWLWRDPLEAFGDGDLFAGVRRLGMYFRSMHGCLDWRWIYHNSP